MHEGVRKSKAIIVLLTSGMMARPFCQKELRWAKKYSLEFVGVSEQDPRRGPVAFDQEREAAPADLKWAIDDVEYIPFRRKSCAPNPNFIFSQLALSCRHVRRLAAGARLPAAPSVEGQV